MVALGIFILNRVKILNAKKKPYSFGSPQSNLRVFFVLRILKGFFLITFVIK